MTRYADDPLWRKLQELEDRVRKAEHHEHPATATTSTIRPAIFHMEGTLSLMESDPDRSATARSYTKIVGSLKVAGSSTTTVDVLVDGGLVGAVSLLSGEEGVVADAQVFVPALAGLTVETTALGTGAEGLEIVLE